MNLEQLPFDKDMLDEFYQSKAADDFLCFALGLTIPSASGPQLLKDCIASFQRECFESLVPSLHAVRDGEMPSVRRFWIERTKKAAKDSDVAICLAWLAAYARRPMLGQVLAADQDQAGIVKERVEHLLYYNPWLDDRLQIVRNEIRSADGVAKIKIEPSDKASVHGPTPDILILNELVHVAKWEVMEAAMNNADGVPQGIAIVSTNAGYRGTKAEKWKEMAFKRRERWSVHVLSETAPWLNQEDISEAKERNTQSEFERLFHGLWVSGKGDALSEDLIEGCFNQSLFPLDGPEKGWFYLSAFDLGISHDHSAVVVLGVDMDRRRFRVAQIRNWEPSIPNDRDQLEVDIEDVKRACIQINETFRPVWWGYDPQAGGSFVAQELRQQGLPMREVSFAGKILDTMALTLKQVLEEGRLECFEDERLRRDLGKFCVVKKSYGYKLQGVSDEHGHADVGTALVICLPEAVSMLGGFDVLSPDDKLFDDDDTPLTEEEVREMPDELREIYEMEDEPIRPGGYRDDRDGEVIPHGW